MTTSRVGQPANRSSAVKHRTPQTFDVVIGADGIHSNVRGLAFGDESRFIRHLGPYVAIWDLPVEMFAPGTGFMYSHPGRTVGVERLASGGAARAFLPFVHPAPGTVNRQDTDEILRTLRDAFAEDRWRTREIIDTLPRAEDVYFDTVSQIRMDRWSTGRIALVGDAAYERRLRDYVEKNQKLALRTDSTVIARSRRQLLRRNIKLCVVPWLQRVGLLHLLQTKLRTAATDLSLSSHDRQRSVNARA